MIKIGKSTAKAIINAPLEAVNLGEWMFTITSDEYAACAEGHQSAAQGKLASGKRVSVNVEIVSGMFMIQHYIENIAERSHVLAISPNTIFWLNDTNYVLTHITWELGVTIIDENSCELTCSVISETENEAFVKRRQEAMKDLPANHNPAQQHIDEETPLFAKDIERKALAGVWS
jgi:hypothetical protein